MAADHQRTLIFHIGWHKTGSTSLQGFFQANREVLYREAGIYYPETGLAGASHRPLSTSLRDDADSCPSLWKLLGRELRGVDKARHVLISAEGMHQRDPARVRGLMECLPAFDRIVVIAYVRQPDNLLESWFGQRIVNGDFCGGVEDFLAAVESQGWLDFEGRISRWRGIAPRTDVKVRPFERRQWHRNDLLRDFFHQLGWPDPSTLQGVRPTRDDNRRYGSHLLSLVREINGSVLRHEGKERTIGFYALLHRLDRCEWLERPDDVQLRIFQQQQRRELRERFQPVFERLGVRFSDEPPEEQGDGGLAEFAGLPESRRIELLETCMKAAVLLIDDLQDGFEHYRKAACDPMGACQRLERDKAMLKEQGRELRGQFKNLQREHRELKRQFGKTLRSRLLKWKSWWRLRLSGRAPTRS